MRPTPTSYILVIAVFAAVAGIAFGRAPNVTAEPKAPPSASVAPNPPPDDRCASKFRGALARFYGIDRDPVEVDAILQERLRHSHANVMVATVADPLDSGLPLEFDRTLEAITLAASAHELLRDVGWLPWFDPSVEGPERKESEECRRRVPGIVTFRSKLSDRSRATEDSEEATQGNVAAPLLVLLVGETPTWGVHRRALGFAFAFARRIAPSTIRVLGPTFSGSARSASEQAVSWYASASKDDAADALLAVPKVIQFVSGTATDPSLRHELARPENPEISFELMAVDHSQMKQRIMCDFLHEQLGIPIHGNPGHLEHVAMLVESTTQYGSQSLSSNEGPCGSPELSLTFPLHISSLRSEYERAEHVSPGAPLISGGPIVELPSDSGGESLALDVEPHLSARGKFSDDMLLRLTLGEISRRSVRYVGIVATDTADVIFLAGRIHAIVPDVRLFAFTREDTFLQTAYRARMDGMLVASPYRPDPVHESAAHGPFLSGIIDGKPSQHPPLASDRSDGIYEAADSIMRQLDPSPKSGPPPSGAVWISVLSGGHYWPLARVPIDRSEQSASPMDTHRKPPRLWVVAGLGIALLLAVNMWWIWKARRDWFLGSRADRGRAVADTAPPGEFQRFGVLHRWSRAYQRCDKARLAREQASYVLIAAAVVTAGAWFLSGLVALAFRELTSDIEDWLSYVVTAAVGITSAFFFPLVAIGWAAWVDDRDVNGSQSYVPKRPSMVKGFVRLMAVTVTELLDMGKGFRSWVSRMRQDAGPISERSMSDLDRAELARRAEVRRGGSGIALLAAFAGLEIAWGREVLGCSNAETVTGFFLERAMTLESGASPATPVFLTLGCLFVWTICNLHRLRILDSFYFRDKGQADPKEQDQDEKSHTRPISQILGLFPAKKASPGSGGAKTVGGEIADLEGLLARGLRRPSQVGHSYAVLMSICLGSVCIAFWMKPVLTVELPAGGVLIRYLALVCLAAIVSTLARAIVFSTGLRVFLRHLARHPVAHALERIPKPLVRPLRSQLSAHPFYVADLTLVLAQARHLLVTMRDVKDLVPVDVRPTLENLKEQKLEQQYCAEVAEYIAAKSKKSFPAVRTMNVLLETARVFSRVLEPYWTQNALESLVFQAAVVQRTLPSRSSVGVQAEAGGASWTMQIHAKVAEEALLAGAFAPAAGGSIAPRPPSTEMTPETNGDGPRGSGPLAHAEPDHPSNLSPFVAEAPLDAYRGRIPPAAFRWLELAEEFIASQVAICVVAWLIRHFRQFATVLVVGSCWAMLMTNVYVFQPKRLMTSTAWLLILTTFLSGAFIFVRLDQDELLSRIGRRETGTYRMKLDAVVHIAKWAILPAAMLIATQYPGMWSKFTVWFEPLTKALH
jgi:hypothetical protein